MRLTTGLAIILLTAPAAAQIETQELEPLLLPSEGGSITVSPVERQSPRNVPAETGDPFEEGFNDDAFRDERSARPRDPFDNENSFIDRAFSDSARNEEGQFERAPGIESADEATGFDVTPLPPLSSEEEQAEQNVTRQSEILKRGDLPRFKEAPFANRGLFGRGQRRLLPSIDTMPSEVVQLRTLDKMTGATRELIVQAGEERDVGRLRLLVEGCRQAADGGKHGTTAFLRIWDPERRGPEPVFQGWMFAESPALSALDHPRYDVWVVSCEPERAAGEGDAEEG